MDQTDGAMVRGKYAPLFNHLKTFEEDEWSASFVDIEEILGFSLPRSARKFPAWWSNQNNSGSHTHAQAWQRAGWKARSVNLAAETLIFERTSTITPRWSRDSSEDSTVTNGTFGLRQKFDGETADRTEPKPNNRPAHALFEQLAGWVMSDSYGVALTSGKLGAVNKIFDMVSEDGTVVGDAKYFTMVGGERLPPAKFSIIAEHVWLLEKTSAAKKFLVFGNDRRVPEKWLDRYGDLVNDITFYFLSNDGHLEVLKGKST